MDRSPPNSVGEETGGGRPRQTLDAASLQPQADREDLARLLLAPLNPEGQEQVMLLGLGLAQELLDARRQLSELRAEKAASEEAAKSLRAKVDALIEKRTELKERARQLAEENQTLRNELETLKSGMEGLAYSHGRLLKNYNDQIAYNRGLVQELNERRGTGNAEPASLAPPRAESAPAQPSTPAAPRAQGGVPRFPRLNKVCASTEKFVSTRYGFVFLAVPKAASQGVLEGLLQLHPEEKSGFVFTGSLEELFDRYPATWNYLKFSVVRHPFSRAVSCYIDKVLDADPNKRRLFERVGLKEPPGSFAELVELLSSEAGRDEVSDRHWISQSALLTDEDGRLIVDHLARAESLEQDLELILGRIGVKLPTLRKVNRREEHLNLGGGEASALSDGYYHTPELEARLGERYRRDYALFGYLPFQQRS